MHSCKLLFLNQNICCGYSKEPSQCDDSFEHPKHMFRLLGKKIITILHSKILLKSVHKILLLIPSASSEGLCESAHMCRLARAFAACIHKKWMYMKTRTKIQTSNPAGYYSMSVYKRYLHICCKYQNLVCWPIYGCRYS